MLGLGALIVFWLRRKRRRRREASKVIPVPYSYPGLEKAEDKRESALELPEELPGGASVGFDGAELPGKPLEPVTEAGATAIPADRPPAPHEAKSAPRAVCPEMGTPAAEVWADQRHEAESSPVDVRSEMDGSGAVPSPATELEARSHEADFGRIAQSQTNFSPGISPPPVAAGPVDLGPAQAAQATPEEAAERVGQLEVRLEAIREKQRRLRQMETLALEEREVREELERVRGSDSK
ncbi:MAG: hypothetical protein M1832_004771 [Thelocarpon impressellum]|nr:MAG: hypothetical protein M1832_004771 [Thelocarpon impressellum]